MRDRKPAPPKVHPATSPENENLTLDLLTRRLRPEDVTDDPKVHAAAERLIGVLQIADLDALRLLVLQAPGLLDKLARSALASAGRDRCGHWVGFDKAREVWGPDSAGFEGYAYNAKGRRVRVSVPVKESR